MSLASVYNVPKDARSLAEFAFNNRLSHLSIAQAIQTKTGVILSLPVLDPMPVFDLQNWAVQHQAVHNAMNGVLGLEGNDLTDVNWEKPEEVESWIRLHADEHYKASQVLGIA